MKKLTYLFLALLIVACSDDQGNNANDDNSNDPILGTWSLVSWELDGQIQNLDSCDFLSYIMFNSDLSFERMWYETISGDCIIEGNDTGSYLYNTDNNLIILEFEDIDDGPQIEFFNILELSNSSLMLTLFEEEQFLNTFGFIKN
ncbi:lipocalin family protein [Flavobacteriaceae bacterium]|nr:lipocalin family protein [Flavobacteriaceae bacterium]